MVCISTGCPKYGECKKTISRWPIEDAVPFASCATGTISAEKWEILWWCGPHGDYRLFEPKTRM